MGCRPAWDPATGRVTGVEVLPCAAIGRARVDVTWRISGLFRDLFPAQIALLDAAVKAVAARDEADDENPLAAARRSANGHSTEALARIFGTAPGAYGAGIDDLIGSDAGRDDIGASYLAAASHAYGGADGESSSLPGAFAERVADADLLDSHRRRSGARSARRRGGRSLCRRFCRRSRVVRAQPRPDHARHHRSADARARGRSPRRWRASCVRVRSIRASSPARCGTVRAARRNWPRPWTA